jgi:hypothetical protein
MQSTSIAGRVRRNKVPLIDLVVLWKAAVISEVGGHLDHMLPRCARRLEQNADVLERPLGLFTKAAQAELSCLRIDRALPRDVDHSTVSHDGRRIGTLGHSPFLCHNLLTHNAPSCLQAPGGLLTLPGDASAMVATCPPGAVYCSTT